MHKFSQTSLLKGVLPYVYLCLRCLGYIFVVFFVWLLLSMHTLVRFLPHVLQLTGFPFSTKTYLILLQNDAELRPGGGFISAYGELSLRNGIIPSFFIQDVFTLKGYKDEQIQEPPYPMGELLKNEYYKGFSFHDSNWYPDLKTSAETTLKFYKEEFPDKNIDGIVTVNFSVIEDLLGLAGPIQISTGPIEKDTLFHTIEYHQNNIDLHNTEVLYKRKSILSELAPAFSKKLLFSIPKYPQIFQLLSKELDGKNIALYFKDQGLQQAFTDYKWSGSFPTPKSTEDFFGVVEANLGGMKSDRYITRSLEHFTTITRKKENSEKLQAEAKVRLVFRHTGDYNPPLSHVYKGYVRVYVPKGSTLLPGYSSDIEPYEELGYTVFGKKVELRPKETGVIELGYSLPESLLKDNQYRLRVFKQSGMQNTTYVSSVTTPVDHIITSRDYHTMENSAYFSEALTQDAELSLQFTTDKTPPRVTNQEFIDVNRIIVQFNEPLLESDCLNVENYDLIDTDTISPEVTNRPKIRFIKCEDRQATIYTQNIRKQEEEHFILSLKNIRDMGNNIMTPNPMKITIIQRLDKKEK